MSDTTQILQLPGALLASIDRSDDSVILHFSQVHLLQEMEGAFNDSLWAQAVNLTIKGVRITGDLPDCPCEISGGDLTDNIFTYRDHAPLPIDWHGETCCKLTVSGNGGTFTVDGESMQLEQIDHPRYIKHVDK